MPLSRNWENFSMMVTLSQWWWVVVFFWLFFSW